MEKFNRLSLVVTLLWFLCSGNTLNWQGTGNLSQANRTIIWGYINTNFSTTWTISSVINQQASQITNFTTSFSDFLNNLWAPAWNTVAIYQYETKGYNYDQILYGYAFRDHWMWFNGFKMDDGYYVNFVLWKDYNCVNWFTFNTLISGYSKYSFTEI